MKNKLFFFNFSSFFLAFTFLLQTNFCKSQCCTYTLNMQDSYGDGWNGGYLSIYVNNALLANYSGNNYVSSDTFQLCNNDTLDLEYTPGSYEDENSYQLYDAAYNLLFSDEPSPETGNVFTSFGNCASIILPGSNACTAIPNDTGQCVMIDNTGYLGSGLNPNCANYAGGDVWFTTDFPQSGNLSFQTDSGTINNTGIAVWTGSSCTNLTFLSCNDDEGNGNYSLLFLNDLPPGQTLYIQVWGYGGATGSFQLCVKDIGEITLESSELPIVMINTLGQTIIEDTKINALMDIKYNGSNTITYLTDPSNIYSGNIGIEVRGATSASYPQKPYGIETRDSLGANNNVSILGMPAENDWVLLSNYNDRSLVRNTLAYKLFGDMGNYSVRTSLCEVLLDSVYKGIYVFGEKIKPDMGRVNIAKLTALDNTGDQLTGGYILQQNYWDAYNSFQTNYPPIDHPDFDVHFVYVYPSADSITVPQKIYIASYIDSLEVALYSPNFSDPIVGYRKYLDVKSFIDYFLINELSRNNDGFKKSVFFHKNKYSEGGKLKAGPAWDFDWAWKNIYGCSIFEATDGSGWAHQINDCPTDNYSCGYYVRLLQDTSFTDVLKCTYVNYRQTILDTTYIFSYLDSVRNLVQNAQARHFQRWLTLGASGPAEEVNAIATTYNAEIDTLKAWINLRLHWLDANIPGICSPVAIEQFNPVQPLQFYPNPTTGNIHFEGFINEKSLSTLKLYDVYGKLIEQINLDAGNIHFNFQLYTKGVFYFEITNHERLVQHGKIVVV